MITGSLVALVTPFYLDSYKIDWNSLKRLIDWHVEQDTDGIVIAGTTGESSTLDVDEHSHIIDFVVKYVVVFECIMGMTTSTCANSFQSSRPIVIIFLIDQYRIILLHFLHV